MSKTLLLSIVIFIHCFKTLGQNNEFKKMGFVFIPSASFQINEKIFKVNSFFILNHEVSNREYLEFIQFLKDEKDTLKLQISNVIDSNWFKISENSSLMDYYFHHDAYADYPVVNITKEGAQFYVEWLNGKYKKKLEKDSLFFSLPTMEEWSLAASGGLTSVKYSWGQNYLKSESGEKYGNFYEIGDECIHFNDSIQKYEIICEELDVPVYLAGEYYPNGLYEKPDSVYSYEPNRYGIYNMSGNVAEMLQDKDFVIGGSYIHPGFDVRINSYMRYTNATPYIGFRLVLRKLKP